LIGLGLASGTAQAVNQPPEMQSKPGIIAVNPQTRVHVAQGGGA